MNFKKIIAIATLAVLMVPAFVLTLPVQADLLSEEDLWVGQDNSNLSKDQIQGELGLGEKDPREIIASVINIALGFLGIVAVVLILLGGFKWMTAAGNDDKITEARSILTAGIIGLVIILAAWGVASFVINQLLTATTT